MESAGDGGAAGTAKPARVPIKAAHTQRGKIAQLPEDLKSELDRLLGSGSLHSSRTLSKWLSDNGYEISHAAIHQYGRKFEMRLGAIRTATEQARIVCEQFDGDEAHLQSALMRLVQTRLFEVLTAVNERSKRAGARGTSATASVNLTALARSVSGLVRAEAEHKRWKERARKSIEAAQKKIDEARTSGLPAESAEQIKDVLMKVWE